MSNSDSESGLTYRLWYYKPSAVVGIVSTAVFAILTIAHTIRLFRKKAWFCIPLIIGGLFETVGYVFRIRAHYDIASTMNYAAQSILILLAPILFAASVYMFLGRIITAANGEKHSMIRTRWLTKIFVCGDILCFFVQAGGGGILSSAKKQSSITLGERVILGGLILQILVFLFFVAVAVVWNRRMRIYTTSAGQANDFNWQRSMLTLYVASTLIVVRNVVRCIEYGAGSTGYLLTHEWTTYVFDALLMAIVLAVAWTWYGSNVTLFQNRRRDEESLGGRSHQMPAVYPKSSQ